MDSDEFRDAIKVATEFTIEFMDTVRNRKALAEVEPGYLHKRLAESVPLDPEPWHKIMDDFIHHIVPGISPWWSPKFNAFFPTCPGFPDILGEFLAASLGSACVSWISSPAITELEVIVMDWLAKLLDLPEHFLASSPGPGGGVLHTSASEGFIMALAAAREWKTKEIQKLEPNLDRDYIYSKLVFYTSDQSNSSHEKTGKLACMLTRLLPSNDEGSLTLDCLRAAVEKDKADGFIPCFAIVTLGTTAFCSMDHLEEIGPYCAKEEIWLHVDAAYAGSALICPEFRYIKKGLEYADSFVFNPYKWIMTSLEASAFWIKNRNLLIDATKVDRVYLEKKHDRNVETYAPEFRHWGVHLGTKFRSLKLWFTLRSYGVKGLQSHIRNSCQLADVFVQFLQSDGRFQIFHPFNMSLIAFRLKDDNDNKLTKKLLSEIISSKELFMVGAEINGVFYIRYVVTSIHATQSDIRFAYTIISKIAHQVLESRKLTSIFKQFEHLNIKSVE